jgi:L-rhamnose-H+ transport protein
MNSFYGIALIAIGSFASAVYYWPLKKLTNWSWETGWLVQGVFAWIIGPWLIAMVTVPHLFEIIGSSPRHSIYMPVLFGLGWGIGGLTWGLSIRYLGIGLGNSLPLGITLALSTLIPPFMDGTASDVFIHRQGIITIAGVVIALIGIAICGWAATLKDHEISVSKNSEAEGFDSRKGFAVALVAGIMSACFAFGEKSGQSMVEIAKQMNPGSIWVYNPVYAIILIGGFIANAVYCVSMIVRRKSFIDFRKPSTGKYYWLAGLAGVLWFSQFVFKGMGTSKMNADMRYITWCLLFSLVIIFSNLIGIIIGEWKGVLKKTILVLSAGLLVMLLSVLVIGFAPVL